MVERPTATEDLTSLTLYRKSDQRVISVVAACLVVVGLSLALAAVG
ncbi:hypothetical protein [Frankia sp. AiPa1]|nr:hypothetical protein [Frankia sp. AiPa1]MCL9759836.1 hypothetical protein [Frankia sp. AiPa1]